MVLRAIGRDTPKNDELNLNLYAKGGAVAILAQSLVEWRENCPGAGWEHHNQRALASLVACPAMGRLLALARTGLLAEEREKLRAEGSGPLA